MPKGKSINPRFNPLGKHAKNFVRYAIGEIQKAQQAGVDPCQADLTWKTFAAARPEVVQEVQNDHPGPSDDPPKLARNNYNKAIEKIGLIVHGQEGVYPENFQREAGILEANIFGICSNREHIQAGDNRPADAQRPNEEIPEDEGEDLQPLADDPPVLNDEPPPPAPAPRPRRRDPPEISLEDKIDEKYPGAKKIILEATEKFNMEIKQIVLKNVELRTHPSGTCDVACCKVRAYAGTILKTFEFLVDLEDGNLVQMLADIDPNILDQEICNPPHWWVNSELLASRIARGFNETITDEDKQIREEFRWEDCCGNPIKVLPQCLDPWELGLRDYRAGPMDSLYEMEMVPLATPDGEAVPCWDIYAFFPVVSNIRHVRTKGNLRLDGRRPPAAPLDGRHRNFGHGVVGGNDGGGGGGGGGNNGGGGDGGGGGGPQPMHVDPDGNPNPRRRGRPKSYASGMSQKVLNMIGPAVVAVLAVAGYVAMGAPP